MPASAAVGLGSSCLLAIMYVNSPARTNVALSVVIRCTISSDEEASNGRKIHRALTLIASNGTSRLSASVMRASWLVSANTSRPFSRWISILILMNGSASDPQAAAWGTKLASARGRPRGPAVPANANCKADPKSSMDARPLRFGISSRRKVPLSAGRYTNQPIARMAMIAGNGQ